MKKVILSLATLFFTVLNAQALVIAPQWSEFCPSVYLNVSVPQNNFASNERKYWAQRRIEFYENLNACRAESNPRLCYDDIRANELRKNNSYYGANSYSYYEPYLTYVSYITPTAIRTTPSVVLSYNTRYISPSRVQRYTPSVYISVRGGGYYGGKHRNFGHNRGMRYNGRH